MKTHPLIIGAGRVATRETAEVINPYTGRAFARVHLAGPAEVEKAITSAAKAFEITRRQSSHAVASLLRRVVEGMAKKRARLVDSIVAEAGKPVSLAAQEVDRSITTFTIAAEEASRLGGEYLPVDIDARSEGRAAVTRRFPIGVVAGITPFNFPLNLVAHKVAPAIASRNAIVIKPATTTPLTALMLGEILLEAGMTPGQVNIIPCRAEVGERLAISERVAKLSFTGSAAVGWRLKNLAGRKRVTLELGGNAAAVIHSGADLDWAVKRTALGAFGYAGQTCISVQRILVHKPVYAKVVRMLVKETTANIKAGDPRRPDVTVGPMIDRAALNKTREWVKEAVAGGARILAGGRRRGPCYLPTLIAGVNPRMKVVCQEVFAPVAVVQSYATFDQAIGMVNDSEYGLQAGVFTSDLAHAFEAFESCEVGGVIVNDFPTFRVDNMPYGGVKMSGFGREGVRYAMEEMTELRVMVIRR